VSVEPKTFAGEFTNWWRVLQPEWRVHEGSLDLSTDDPPDDETWEELAKPGKNGLFLLMLALWWWSSAVDQSDVQSEKDVWIHAAQDVDWVLTQILNSRS
jgi:hypothetical protein